MQRLFFIALGCSNACAFANDDWPGFRGGTALGVSTNRELPVRWSAEDGVLSKTTPKGWGNSSPIIVGDRLYLTSQTDDTALHVLAYSLDGLEQVWATQVGQGKLKSHDHQNMATATPVSDGQSIWALFGTGDLVCLDNNGTIRWRRDLQTDHGKYEIMWGMGTSPVLHEGKLFVMCAQAGASYVLALDGRTGTDLWKRERALGTANEARDSYSTPILVSTPSGWQLIVSGAEHINAYDPATGEQLWISGGLAVSHPYGRTIAGPTALQDLVITVASGFRNQGHIRAIRLGAKGDITESAHAWTVDRFAPDCPTPVAYQGYVYMIRDDGMASCVDAKTGKPLWQERVHQANVKVSPVAGAGKVYFFNGQADCAVVEASPTFKILAENKLNEELLATPALVRGRIVLRTREHLYLFGESNRE